MVFDRSSVFSIVSDAWVMSDCAACLGQGIARIPPASNNYGLQFDFNAKALLVVWSCTQEASPPGRRPNPRRARWPRCGLNFYFCEFIKYSVRGLFIYLFLARAAFFADFIFSRLPFLRDAESYLHDHCFPRCCARTLAVINPVS